MVKEGMVESEGKGRGGGRKGGFEERSCYDDPEKRSESWFSF